MRIDTDHPPPPGRRSASFAPEEAEAGAACPCCADLDGDGKRELRNVYECDACDIGWEDTWCCACDDDCPECGTPSSPIASHEGLPLTAGADRRPALGL
jgi:hypothetical protein